MDAFYASIEQLDNPALRGKPVVVGSAPNARGVVSAASYEARTFGIHSAMPSRIAFRRCPSAVFMPVRMSRYRAVSQQLMALFGHTTPFVEQLSVDEAFLDVRGVLGRERTAEDVARVLKAEIRSELGLTASIGVATNKFLAKLASDLDKPDGLTVVPVAPEAIRDFLFRLPARRIWGVGKVTAKRLGEHGIATIGQIQARTPEEMSRLVGHSQGRHIWRLAHGLDERPVVAEKPAEKSASHEHTFPVDCPDRTIVRQQLIELTEKVGRRLRKAGVKTEIAQIKVRAADFTTITRQQKLVRPTNSDHELITNALQLLAREKLVQPTRLIGFTASGLVDDASPSAPERQLMLFPEPGSDEDRRHAALDQAVDDLRSRYGHAILRRGGWGKRPAHGADTSPTGE
jgi:DNA polymerase IV